MRWFETPNGYIAAYSGGRKIYQHRHVWEHANGRKIPAGYYIHHKDHNPKNNDPGNLELMDPKGHRELHESCLNPYPIGCASCGTVVTRKHRVTKTLCKPCTTRKAEDGRKTVRHCASCNTEFRSRKGNFCSQRCVNLGARWNGDRLQSASVG